MKKSGMILEWTKAACICLLVAGYLAWAGQAGAQGAGTAKAPGGSATVKPVTGTGMAKAGTTSSRQTVKHADTIGTGVKPATQTPAAAATSVADKKPPANAPSTTAGLTREILELTGGRRTKILWTRGTRADGGLLMCFDTAEGKERAIIQAPKVCFDAKLTPDGKRVIFCVPSEQASYIVNWDGTGLKPLFKGRHYYALGVAHDPTTGVDWVYVGDNMSAEARADIQSQGLSISLGSGFTIHRHRLDNLAIKEKVWDKTTFSTRVIVNPGGASLAGEFPWPNCGVAALPNGEFKLYGQGCNGSLSPDGSRFFLLLGDHRRLKISSVDGSEENQFSVNTMPGNEKDPKRAVWRPKWSNQVRFMSIQSADQGTDADIAIGRFDENFSKIEAWVRVTDTPEYDSDSSVWIESDPGIARK